MKLLISETGKEFLVEENKDFHCTFGKLEKKDLQKEGIIFSNTGHEFAVIKPTFQDMLKKIKRGPQGITPKDIGLIITKTGITKNSKCLDAGTGNGFFTFSLANIAKQVFSYEKRKDFFELSQKNLEFLGLKNVKLKNKDIHEGIKEKFFDLITLDLPDSWKSLKHINKALKLGGWLVCYCPQVSQLQQIVKNLPKNFMIDEITELIKREWDVREKIARPKTALIQHTAFLMFIRKISE